MWETRLLTCTLPPSLSQSSFWWCTSWWAGKQPQSPDWLTGPAAQQTPGCWKSSNYSLKNKPMEQLKQRQRPWSWLFLGRWRHRSSSSSDLDWTVRRGQMSGCLCGGAGKLHPATEGFILPPAWINVNVKKWTLDPELVWVLRSGVFRPGGILQTVAGCQP